MGERKLLAWLLVTLSLALPVALAGLAITAPAACERLPTAFGKGVTTRTSNVAGGFIADRCETTRNQDEVQRRVTVINWTGIVVALAICAAAAFAAAALSGRLDGRAGVVGAAACLAAAAIAMALFLGLD